MKRGRREGKEEAEKKIGGKDYKMKMRGDGEARRKK